jgi:hypothetical protein
VRGEPFFMPCSAARTYASGPNRRGIAHLGADAARGCAAGHAHTGLEELEGVGPEKARQLMQARVNQSCSQSWGETGIAFGEHPGAGEKAHLPPTEVPADASIDRIL